MYFKPEYCEFRSNFKFDRNIVSGTDARWTHDKTLPAPMAACCQLDHGNELRWYLNKNTKIFCQINVFENLQKDAHFISAVTNRTKSYKRCLIRLWISPVTFDLYNSYFMAMMSFRFSGSRHHYHYYYHYYYHYFCHYYILALYVFTILDAPFRTSRNNYGNSFVDEPFFSFRLLIHVNIWLDNVLLYSLGLHRQMFRKTNKCFQCDHFN